MSELVQVPRPGVGLPARGLVVVFLLCLLLARLADADAHPGHPGLRYLPFVAAAMVLPVWYGSGRGRAVWLRWRWPLLGAQAVVTFVPFGMFGSGWVGGVSGLLAGLVLLVVPAPWSWLAFAGLAGLELGLWSGVGLPFGPAVYAAGWLLIAFTDSSLAIFGLTRLADMAVQLDATRTQVEGIAADRQRLEAAERLRAAVEERLRMLSARVATALTAGGESDVARGEVGQVGVLAREAVAEVRRVAAAADAPERPAAMRSGMVEPRLARAVLVAVVALFGIQNLLNEVFAAPDARLPASALLTSMTVVAAVMALQLRHSAVGGGRPFAWPWTLALQAVLCYVQIVQFGAANLLLLPFLAGSVLLLVADPLRWVLFAAVVISQGAIGIVTGIQAATGVDGIVSESIYSSAVVAAFGLLVYGLSRLAVVCVELAALQDELAVAAALRERLRIARDAHDVLGLGLSALALKADLVTALIDIDPSRAERELRELGRVATTVRTDVWGITAEHRPRSLHAALVEAADVLATAGIVLRAPQAPGVPVALDVEEALALTVREAVTNIVRHSAARRCAIGLTVGPGEVGLSVENDGAPREGDRQGGHGLDNLRARLASCGGRLDVARDADRFVLRAVAPLSHAVPAAGGAR